MKRPVALSMPLVALVAAVAWADNHDPHATHDNMHEHMQQMHDHMHGRKDQQGQHDQHEQHAAPSAPSNEATKAFEEANAKMHAGMAAALTGDPDIDFMQGMIPHHQGAIDMAEIVLKYGKDPETRKLAEEIIKAQTSEIAMMKEWLAKRGR